MGIPVVTREYTPGDCRISRKPMRLPPRHEMRPDSTALHAEQLRFPNQTHKEPHLVARGKSPEFSRVAAVTWGIFSSYGGDGHLKLRFVPRNQDSCEDMQTPRDVKLCFAGKYGRFCRSGRSQASLISCHSYIDIPINLYEESGIVTF